jgi:hypothetical protein
MDEVEERFIVEYFVLKGWGDKRITAELQSILHSSALSNSIVKRCIKKFNTSDLSGDDDPQPGRPIETLGQVLQKFLERNQSHRSEHPL